MTWNTDFKRFVRQEQAATGCSYGEACRVVLSRQEAYESNKGNARVAPIHQTEAPQLVDVIVTFDDIVSAQDRFEEALGGTTAGVTSGLMAAIEAQASLHDRLADAFSSPVDALLAAQDRFEEALGGTTAGVTSGLMAAIEAQASLHDRLADAFSSPVDALLAAQDRFEDALTGVTAGMTDGIRSAIEAQFSVQDRFEDALTGVTAGMTDGIRSAIEASLHNRYANLFASGTAPLVN